ncbi:MAG: hypothetical protein BWK79_11275 [Beggiatoa sp. IS2]|nr:MAG: hypothetical protein BWK79_11275 [Beggiatoa sp. IS2]
MDWQSLIIAIIAFLSIYLMFLLIRIFADMFIVGIALVGALAAYSIRGFDLYSSFRQGLEGFESLKKLLDFVGLGIPEQPDILGISIMVVIIVMGCLLVCLPFLPFSATYRQILGVEKLTRKEETRVRQWINEEIERNRDDERTRDEF